MGFAACLTLPRELLETGQRMIACVTLQGARTRKEPCLKLGFEPGIAEEWTITTTPEMGITHLGPDVPSMYSTPSMVQLIEGTCVRLITKYVDEGEQSVGFRVDVKHLAPAAIGKQVTANVTLREKNGRRLIFDCVVHSEDGVKIGEGMHERAVIDIKRFTASQQS
jgi:fluoroacetyl-CoA thioesterase